MPNYKNKIRLLLFNTLGNLPLKIKKSSNVLILTSSRSGSTWLVESLTNYRTFKWYNQPFDTLLNNNVYGDLLPNTALNPFFYNLSVADKKLFESFWDKIINGKINPNTNWRIFSKTFSLFYSKKLIKSFFAKDAISFFCKQKELKIIYLTRNPITRGKSNINYGYKDYGEFLFNNFKPSNDLNLDKLQSIYNETDSLLSKHVISWYLENYTICNYLKNNTNANVLLCKYENLVKNSQEEAQKISTYIFEDDRFSLSEKKSKTTQKEKTKTIEVNREEIVAILNCLPNIYPYNLNNIFI